MVHEWQEVPIDGGEPNMSTVGDRELGGGEGSSPNGVEGERDIHVHLRHDALSRDIRHALSKAHGEQGPTGETTAGFLLVCRDPEHGEPRLGFHLRKLRRSGQDALLSVTLPLHVPGNSITSFRYVYRCSVTVQNEYQSLVARKQNQWF